MTTVLKSSLWQIKKLETVIRTGQGAFVLSRQQRQATQLRHDMVQPLKQRDTNSGAAQVIAAVRSSLEIQMKQSVEGGNSHTRDCFCAKPKNPDLNFGKPS